MIHNITNTNNSMNFKNMVNSSMDKEKISKIKRETIQNMQNKKYEEDLKSNKRELQFFGIVSIASTLITAFSKSIKKEMAINSVFLWLLTIAAYINKPKKENYDAQVEIDLKKEMENDSASNK